MAINEDKLMEFLGKFVGDLGATVAAGSVVLGDKLGLYRALAEGPADGRRARRAHRTPTPRYVTEWLRGQAAGGYVEYDAATDTYSLTEEQAFALTDPDGAVYLPGAFQLALGALKAEPRIAEAFRTGDGLGWHEHDDDVFVGCERFFRPGYIAQPDDRAGSRRSRASRTSCARGAAVADVGCGHGASTVLLAQAYPNSTFVGSDYHEGSIDAARKRAAEAGVADRVIFEVATRADVRRHRLRPGGDLRLPARHGRPGRGGAARARVAGAGRHLAGRRAVRRRRRWPTTSTRSAGSTTPSRRCSASRTRCRSTAAPRWCPGGRGGDPQGRHGGRLQGLPAGGRDAVQPGLRGASVASCVDLELAAPRWRRNSSRGTLREPHLEAAAAVDVVHADLPVVRLDDAADDRQAEPGAGRRAPGVRAGCRARRRRTRAAGRPRGCRRTPSVTASTTCRALLGGADTSTTPSAGVCRIALISRLASARCSSRASALTGTPGRRAARRAVRRGCARAGRPRRGRRTRRRPARPARATAAGRPAWIRDSSNRSSTMRRSRSTSARICWW